MTIKEQNLTRPAFLLSLTILLSNISGLLRDISYSNTWNANNAAFAGFLTAFMLPNLLRSLFGEGAFLGAFIPVFSKRIKEDGKEAAWKSACMAITTMVVVLSGLVLIVAGITYFINIQPWFPITKPTYTFALKYIPLLLPYAVFVCASAAFTGVLNYFNYFSLPALSQVFFNLAIILIVSFPCQKVSAENGILILIFSILAIGFLQFLFFAIFSGIKKKLWFKPKFSWINQDVQEIRQIMLPILFANGIHQINTLLDRLLAGYISHVAVNCMYYGHQLIHLPIGLFAAAMSQICLPSLSRAYVNKDYQQMTSTFNRAIIQVLFFTLPAAALLIGSSKTIIEILFANGKFDNSNLNMTSLIILCYLPSIPAFAVLKIFTSIFYAIKETKLITKISLFCVGINLVLNLSLICIIAQYGLALATSISAIMNNIIIYYFGKKHAELHLKIEWKPIFKLLIGAFVCSIIICLVEYVFIKQNCYLSFSFCSMIADQKIHALQRLFSALLCGGIAYILTILIIGGYHDCLKEILKIFPHRKA